jgi:hypothetical protein
LTKKHDELLDADAIKQVFNLMIKYSYKFIGGKHDQLIALKERFEGGRSEHTTKPVKDDNAKNLMQMEKTLSHFSERIRTLLQKLKNKTSKENAETCLS